MSDASEKLVKARADLTLALNSYALDMVPADAVTTAVEALVVATVSEREHEAWMDREAWR